MPIRGRRPPESTIRSGALARMKAAAAWILNSCSRSSCASGWSSRRMLSPPGGITKSAGITGAMRPIRPSTTAVDSTVSLTHFSPDPGSGEARQGEAEQPVVEDLLHAGRRQDRDHRVDEGEFGLVGGRRGFAGMVVAHQRDDAAPGRGAGKVGMAQRVAGTVDPRPLAVPDAEDAVIAPLAAQLRLLRAPQGRRRQVLVDRRLEEDIRRLEHLGRAPELLVEPAQRRAAIAGDIAAPCSCRLPRRAPAASAPAARSPACRSKAPDPWQDRICRRGKQPQGPSAHPPDPNNRALRHRCRPRCRGQPLPGFSDQCSASPACGPMRGAAQRSALQTRNLVQPVRHKGVPAHHPQNPSPSLR